MCPAVPTMIDFICIPKKSPEEIIQWRRFDCFCGAEALVLRGVWVRQPEIDSAQVIRQELEVLAECIGGLTRFPIEGRIDQDRGKYRVRVEQKRVLRGRGGGSLRDRQSLQAGRKSRF